MAVLRAASSRISKGSQPLLPLARTAPATPGAPAVWRAKVWRVRPGTVVAVTAPSRPVPVTAVSVSVQAGRPPAAQSGSVRVVEVVVWVEPSALAATATVWVRRALKRPVGRRPQSSVAVVTVVTWLKTSVMAVLRAASSRISKGSQPLRPAASRAPAAPGAPAVWRGGGSGGGPPPVGAGPGDGGLGPGPGRAAAGGPVRLGPGRRGCRLGRAVGAGGDRDGLGPQGAEAAGWQEAPELGGRRDGRDLVEDVGDGRLEGRQLADLQGEPAAAAGGQPGPGGPGRPGRMAGEGLAGQARDGRGGHRPVEAGPGDGGLGLGPGRAAAGGPVRLGPGRRGCRLGRAVGAGGDRDGLGPQGAEAAGWQEAPELGGRRDGRDLVEDVGDGRLEGRQLAD